MNRTATESSPSMHNQTDSKERSKSGERAHGQSRLWPEPTRIVTHGELAQAKRTPMRQWWEGWSTRPWAPHHSTAGTTQATPTSTKQLGAGTVRCCWGRRWAQSWLFYSWPGCGHINLTMSSCHTLVASVPLPWTAFHCHRDPRMPPASCTRSPVSGLSFSRLFSARHFISSVTTQGSRSHKQISLWQDLKPSHL